MKDPYSVLGVSKNATDEEIKNKMISVKEKYPDKKSSIFCKKVDKRNRLCYNTYKQYGNVKQNNVEMPCIALGACMLAQAEYEQNGGKTHFDLTPSYLRLSQAEKELKAAKQEQADANKKNEEKKDDAKSDGKSESHSSFFFVALIALYVKSAISSRVMGASGLNPSSVGRPAKSPFAFAVAM